MSKDLSARSYQDKKEILLKKSHKRYPKVFLKKKIKKIDFVLKDIKIY